MRVYRQYIKNKNAVILNVKPKNPFSTDELELESFNPNSDIILKNDPQYNNLTYNKAVDNFDRSIQPIPSMSKSPRVPSYYNHKFSNGIQLIGTEYAEIPKVFLRIKIDGGYLLEHKKE